MNDLNALVMAAQSAFEGCHTQAELENAKAQFLGKTGRVTELMKGLASLPTEEKKLQGAAINQAKQAVEMLMNDPDTDGIIMIGEIGGGMEAEAARWIKAHGTKPVVGFIAGQTAPAGRRMGHAGAIVGGKDDTAAAKMAIMRECGIHVVESPAEIGAKMVEVLGAKAKA